MIYCLRQGQDDIVEAIESQRACFGYSRHHSGYSSGLAVALEGFADQSELIHISA